ncbi:ImmA/IrrE family metallo-endopeptidase [Spirosoma litoris]
MTSDQDSKSPQLSLAFRQRCEEIATLQRHELGLYAFTPLTAQVLAQKLQVHIYPIDKLPGVEPEMVANALARPDWSAAIIQQNPVVVMYKPTNSLARQQSDLMHELAHVLLHHPLGSLDNVTGKFLFSPIHEAEATYLGGCLLLPKRAVEWAAIKQFTVEQVMNHFGVSQKIVTWRCQINNVRLGTN